MEKRQGMREEKVLEVGRWGNGGISSSIGEERSGRRERKGTQRKSYKTERTES